MSNDQTPNPDALRQLVADHATPDPKMVSKLDRGKGVKLDYVSHADTTIILCETDPLWTYDYVRDESGRMAIREHGQNLVLEGWLTVFGVTRPCVGTCEKRKVEAEKELTGDLIRNGAMRFGIATKLWSKLDAADDRYKPEPAAPAPDREMTDDEFDKFVSACEAAGIVPMDLIESVLPGQGVTKPLLSQRPALLAEYSARKKAAAQPSTPAENAPETDTRAESQDSAGERTTLHASKAQVRKIQTLFSVLNVKDRAEKLRHIGEIIGIDPPKSTNVLTSAQAHTVIDELEKRTGGPNIVDVADEP